ncbi:MAG: hypothetical protein NUV34_01070 [Sulfuricaulis sp.]|nr:hypothetical protein [Sulfuricaulis sp.]
MIKIVTAPAAYPVTRAEAKEWCRLFADDTSQDGTIDILIAAMTNFAEHVTGRAFVERTLELDMDSFGYCIELPWAPLIGIDSIAYTDINRDAQTVAVSVYEIDTVSEPGKVRPAWGQYWPSIGYGFNPVRIQYRAGYVAPGSPQDLTDNSYLPGELRTFMAARICTLYDNREQFFVGNQQVAEIPRDFAMGLLDKLVIGTRLF